MIGRAVPLVEADKVGIVLVRNGPSKSADERLQGSHGGLKTALTQLRLDGGEGRRSVFEGGEEGGEEGQDGRQTRSRRHGGEAEAVACLDWRTSLLIVLFGCD